MFVHVFGAYFGLAVSRTMYRKDIKDAEPKNCSIYHSDVFSMIGEHWQVQSASTIAFRQKCLGFTIS